LHKLFLSFNANFASSTTLSGIFGSLFLSILIDEAINVFVRGYAHLNGFLFAICGKLAPFGFSLRWRHRFNSARQGIFDHLVDHRFEVRVVAAIKRDALPVCSTARSIP
jgi:hypothetical protein